jgi:hypothetical protein
MAGCSKTQLLPKIARMSIPALPNVFDRYINSGIWPAHSPDFNPCDCSFCGSLKGKVYNSKPQSEKIKENICR